MERVCAELQRQYAGEAVAAESGTSHWHPERVQVIDSDLGHSGASSADREGFRKLVAEVGMGRAGIVLGLEVSRLARNNADWHRLLEMITPMALEAALAVQQELTARLEEADRLRSQQVERARYEADLARQRYMQVDPNNRLVAEALEADWNGKLRALREAQEDCERRRSEDRIQVDEEVRSRVRALTEDFPRLWNDPSTSDRDRKRIVRLLLEDVTLIKGEKITMHVRFKGGTTTTLTPPEVVKQIAELAERHTDRQIAQLLNERGHRSGRGRAFNHEIIKNLRKRYELKSCYEHHREARMLTAAELADRLGVCLGTISNWRTAGLLSGYLVNDKNEYLYEPPGSDPPVKSQGKNLAERRRFSKVVSETIIEEQYER